MRPLVHPRPRSLAPALAALTAAALLVSACGTPGTDVDGAGAGATTPTTGRVLVADSTSRLGADVVATDTPAARLRGELAARLQATTVATALVVQVRTEGSDPTSADAALSAAIDDTAAVWAEVYGDDAGAAFGQAWRLHTDDVLAYADARSGDDPTGAAANQRELTAFADDVGALLGSGFPAVPAASVVASLEDHLDATVAAVDAIVLADPVAPARLVAASETAEATATTIAAGIAAQQPDRYPGDVESPAATLRSALVTGLGAHVAMGAAGDAAALDDVGAELVEGLGLVVPPDQAAAVTAIWQAHSAAVADLAVARDGGDADARQAAEDEVRTTAVAWARALAEVTSLDPATADDVAEGLSAAVIASAGATRIDASTAGPDLRSAMGAVAPVAAGLADALARANPDRLPG